MLEALTLIHVLISLVGILTGFVVVFAMIDGKQRNGWTTWFLWTTVATSVTGYFFPVHKILPSHIVGAISLAVLAIAIFALYKRHLTGGWRRTYVISAVAALYFNVFVLVVQLFMKVPALKAMAPTQSEPPFAIAQFIVLVLFVALGIAAVKKFREQALPRTVAASKSA